MSFLAAHLKFCTRTGVQALCYGLAVALLLQLGVALGLELSGLLDYLLASAALWWIAFAISAWWCGPGLKKRRRLRQD